MSHAIKFHSAHRDLAHIQIYIDNGFLIPNRFIDIVAIGIHHTAAAGAHLVLQYSDLLRTVKIMGVHTFCDILIHIDYIAVTLNGNMFDCVLPDRKSVV